MKRKVLITAEVHEYLTERLRNSTCEVVYQPKITYDELLNCVELFDGLIVTTRLKLIAQLLKRQRILSGLVVLAVAWN